MAKRLKLNLEGQVAHMEKERGIKFGIMNTSQALDFLRAHNFYFKAFGEKNYTSSVE